MFYSFLTHYRIRGSHYSKRTQKTLGNLREVIHGVIYHEINFSSVGNMERSGIQSTAREMKILQTCIMMAFTHTFTSPHNDLDTISVS